MRTTVCLMLLLPMLGCLAALPARADSARGARLATACAACHGPQGRSEGSIPALAGLSPDRFIQRMAAFRDGEGTLMKRVVPAYSHADVVALAHYFADQPARRPGASN